MRWYLTLMTMSVWSTVLSSLHDVASPLAGGVIALGSIRYSNRYQDRQRERERAATADAAVRDITEELFTAVTALHVALRAHIPTHNAWRPKFTAIGMSLLEYGAGRARGGHYVGMAEAARTVLAAAEREQDGALAIRAPLERVIAAAARAALLPSGAVRTAALELAEAATASVEAYGQNNLWRPKKAAQARDDADTALYAALRNLLDVVDAQLHPVEQPRRSWWRPRRRAVAPATPAALDAAQGGAATALPALTQGEHRAGPGDAGRAVQRHGA